ncbi:hypothetical protein T4B_15591 [Trichinella pseudospiralis]|uniref:Uncharacterized protein n=1 Tax=Trichinella pseudospiralis TaxID=6337 RepID=A0A0V1ITL1_TRIPS|nr:hypothetical protein T4A_2595 [Trichinella pseudospiralis]KRZ26116.1 hypothetical protein T4B_15591 [Trichinella pseudospiralis]
MIKFTILRSVPDSFEKAVKIAAREKLMINQVTASTRPTAAIHAGQPSDIDKLAMKVKELLAGEIAVTTKIKAVSQQHWTCGQLSHFSRDCHSHTGRQLGRDEPQSRGVAVSLAAEEVMKGSKVLRRFPKPSICLETATGADLAVTNAYVIKVKGLSNQFLLGWDFIRSHGCTPDPVANCLRIRQSSIPFTEPIAAAPVGTKSANS